MLVIQSKKSGSNTKNSEIENKITTDFDHNKYVLLLFRKVTAQLLPANLANKGKIINFVISLKKNLMMN